MLRVGENLVDRTFLDLLALPHDDDMVGHFCNHAHVMGDEDHAHAECLLQVAHDVEDLRLNGHVERGGRLVGDQQLWAAGKRHGDHHALAHAAPKAGAGKR